MDKKKLLSIGEISKIVKITTKTLRHYDKINLIKPAFIDPVTNYRYYKKEQLFWILMIRKMKNREFSLSEIKNMFKTGDIEKILKIYEDKRNTINNEIKKLQESKNSIDKRIEMIKDSILINKNEILDEIKIQKIKDRYVAFYREIMPFNIESISYQMNKIQNLIEEYNLQERTPSFCIFHDDFDQLNINSVDFEFCYNLSKKPKINYPFIKKIPAGSYLSFMHKGSFEESISSFKKIKNWCKENNYFIDGPLMRFYFMSYFYSKSTKNVLAEFQIKVKK